MNMTHAGAPIERYRFRQTLLSGRLPMIAEGLLKMDLRFNGRLLELNATEKLIGRIEGSDKKPVKSGSDLKTLECVTPGEVVRKRLLFEGRLQKSLEEFGNLMEEERLHMVLDRLGSKGMNKGIVALFHGGPGTGKTESVMQMAAATGREVLRVNLSEIRNKYVGETEKAVKRIFEEYRSHAKSAALMPVLLFNEADGVLGRRIRVSTSVDQMNNTMQNILLEELERFSGVLVATTNLATNLDPAFERRFTFKFAFENGGADLRERLWKVHFPGLDDVTLRRLAGNYDLSPAQIANLAKRHEIRGLVTGEERNDLEHFMELAEEENLKGASDARTIGFRTR
jgi:SpoVK/Ycf46/Vps4 family AAA+-type ATPase